MYSWRELPDEQRYNQMPLDQEFLEPGPLAARLPMAEGEALLRGVRVAHAGCPNETTHDRVLPGFQIESP